MAFAARYPGRCAACDEGFPEGTAVEFTDRDELIHAGRCPAPALTALDLAPGEQVCPHCRTVHRGECV